MGISDAVQDYIKQTFKQFGKLFQTPVAIVFLPFLFDDSIRAPELCYTLLSLTTLGHIKSVVTCYVACIWKPYNEDTLGRS